jgi:hypothetical protein
VEAWLTRDLDEEEIVEGVLGPIDPGTQVTRTMSVEGRPEVSVSTKEECTPDIADLPSEWSGLFPAGRDLTAEAIRRRPGTGKDADGRLVDRYRCEFGLFKVVETAHTLPLITGGFPI